VTPDGKECPPHAPARRHRQATAVEHHRWLHRLCLHTKERHADTPRTAAAPGTMAPTRRRRATPAGGPAEATRERPETDGAPRGARRFGGSADQRQFLNFLLGIGSGSHTSHKSVMQETTGATFQFPSLSKRGASPPAAPTTTGIPFNGKGGAEVLKGGRSTIAFLADVGGAFFCGTCPNGRCGVVFAANVCAIISAGGWPEFFTPT